VQGALNGGDGRLAHHGTTSIGSGTRKVGWVR
jgi:hypothetical protein